MGNDEVVISKDAILSTDSIVVNEILQNSSQTAIRVEDPTKYGEYSEYEKEDLKDIVHLLDGYYEIIEQLLGIIKEKNSKAYYENEDKIICTVIAKIVARHIKSSSLMGLGSKVDAEKTDYLSCTYNTKFQNDKEFCFVLIEMLKRFGFQVGNSLDRNVSLGYLGFADRFNINREYYVCLVKIDGQWYALNSNGFVTETTIKYDEGMRSKFKSAQDKIAYLCTKLNEGDFVVKEGMQQETIERGGYTYTVPIKIRFVPKKEKGELYSLANTRVAIESKKQDEEDDGQVKHRTIEEVQAQKVEFRRQKSVERNYNIAQRKIELNERLIKSHRRTVNNIERIESQISKIDLYIQRLEGIKNAMAYESTYGIGDRIQYLQEIKRGIKERLPEKPKEFYQNEIQRLEQENLNFAGTITEHQDEVTSWREARAVKRNEKLSKFVKKVSTVKLPRPSLGKKENIERENSDVDIEGHNQ